MLGAPFPATSKPATEAGLATTSIWVFPFCWATCVRAMAWPPPGMFWTTIGCGASFSLATIWAMVRDRTSLPPPGAAGATIVMGLLGVNSAACT